jgi:hypothetical protein
MEATKLTGIYTSNVDICAYVIILSITHEGLNWPLFLLSKPFTEIKINKNCLEKGYDTALL